MLGSCAKNKNLFIKMLVSERVLPATKRTFDLHTSSRASKAAQFATECEQCHRECFSNILSLQQSDHSSTGITYFPRMF